MYRLTHTFGHAITEPVQQPQGTQVHLYRGKKEELAVCVLCVWRCVSVAQLQQKDKIAASVTGLLHKAGPTCSFQMLHLCVCARVFMCMCEQTAATDVLEWRTQHYIDIFHMPSPFISNNTHTHTHSAHWTHHKATRLMDHCVEICITRGKYGQCVRVVGYNSLHFRLLEHYLFLDALWFLVPWPWF